MSHLAADEKITTVMAYSSNKLIHGGLVTKQNIRVSILPRMQALTNFLHLQQAQIWFFGGAEPRLLSYADYFFPVDEMLGFHIAPPACDPVDYEAGLANRSMSDINVILGVFLLKGKILVSTQVELGANLELAHKSWLSVYEADISSPFLPQMPVVHVPMLLLRAARVSFGN